MRIVEYVTDTFFANATAISKSKADNKYQFGLCYKEQYYQITMENHWDSFYVLSYVNPMMLSVCECIFFFFFSASESRKQFIMSFYCFCFPPFLLLANCWRMFGFSIPMYVITVLNLILMHCSVFPQKNKD